MNTRDDYDDFGNLRSWQPPAPKKQQPKPDQLDEVLEQAAKNADAMCGDWLPRRFQVRNK